MEKIKKIVELLALHKSEVAKNINIRLSGIKNNPDLYLSNNGRMLTLSDDFMWLAMVDLLTDNSLAFETDWKTSYAEAGNDISGLFSTYNIVLEMDDEDIDEDADAEEFFPLVNKKLAEMGTYRLYNIDINSDSYVTVLSRIEKKELLYDLDSRITMY